MGLTKPLINSEQGILRGFDARNMLLINVNYMKGNRESKRPDVCTVVYKDMSTGEKHMMEIEHPLMRMYVVKPEKLNTSYYPEFLPHDECDEYIVPFNEVLPQIARIAGGKYKQFMDWCKETGNYYQMKKLHHYPGVLGTDFPYENYFRIEWMLHYAQKGLDETISKQYMDIEVDTIDIKGMPKEGECPINAITVVDDDLKTCFTFLLRNPKNPQIEAFEANIESFIAKLHAAFDESYGEIKYRIYMYDDEVELIRDMFRLVNTLKRDFMLIWNLPFDIPYIMARLNYLGIDPSEIMCHPDFKYKYCWFKKDRRNFDFKTKKDIFRLASYTVFQDQMINYAKVRKGQAEIPSLKLNAIGLTELNDEKLDYSDEANIKTLPYVDYEKFVMYNIKDVLLQFGIENKCKDLETIFQRAYDNATDYDSIFSQTIFLKNCVFMDYYRNLNLIKGNNVNIKYDSYEDDEKAEDDLEEYELDENGEPDWTRPISHGFEGALVGNPVNNDNVGEFLYGRQSKYVFSHVIDFD